MKTIKLSNCEVQIKDSLKWGEVESIIPDLNKPNRNDLEINYKVLEFAVIKIIEKGAEVSFSREWMKGLDLDDAILLIDSASGLIKKNIKTSSQS